MNQQIIVISWSHRQNSLDFRDKIALSQKEIKQCIYFLLDKKHIVELTVLSTCNRIEFYVFAKNSVDVCKYIQTLYAIILKRLIPWHQSIPVIYSNIEAIQHLCRVASGIESMILGESQILSQVKSTREILTQSQPDANVLIKLFNDAIQCAETVRNNIKLYIGPTSISELAVITAKKIYNNLDKRKVLLIGAGETAALTAHYLKASGINKIIIANRSEKRGKSLAISVSGDYIDMSCLNDALYKCDAIVAATHAKSYLIGNEQIKNIMSERKEKLLLIDLSTPRNIDPSICDLDNVVLYDLEYLDVIASKNKRINKKTIEAAEMIIQDHSRELMDRFYLNDLKGKILELAE